MNAGPLPPSTAQLDACSLQRALGVGQVVVWRWNLDDDSVACSSGAREFFGVEIGHLSDFRRVFHPDDLARVEEATRDTVRSGGEYQVDYRLRLPAGGWRWVQSRGRVELGPGGRPAQVIGTTVDISNQVRAEEAIRLLARAGDVLNASLDYDATLAALADLVVPAMADWYALDLLDDQGELRRVAVVHPDPQRVAQAAELYRRYPPVRGSPGHWQVIETGQVDWAPHITDAMLAQAAKDPAHLRLMRALQPCSYIMVPLVARGSTLGVMLMVFAESNRHYTESDVKFARDLAQRAAVAVDNARLFQQLQMADQRKDEFLAMLAHELRNPLAPISTAAQMLRMAPCDEALVRQAGAIIARQMAHMTDLVDDLLDVSRVTRGLIRLDRQVLDLRDIVDAAVEQAEAGIRGRGQRLLRAGCAEPLCVEGDPARLVQVVANLLTNANKYTPPGGRIELSCRAEADQAVLSVCDTGAGIEPDLLPHVFELFTQGRRNPDRSQGGLGIGLALVQRIVHLHGGEIHAHSGGQDQGSCFTLRLPRVASRQPPAPLLPSKPLPAAPSSPRRFLVVDDNVDAAESLAQMLRLAGHEAVAAFDGSQALRQVETHGAFDVAVLDIGLPDMTGYALAERIAASSPRRPRLVALTGYDQAEDRERSVRAGFDHHLVKPADVSELLALLGD